MPNDLKPLFLLDPQIHFLNHGSFGACPRAVFTVYQQWQRRLEKQPVRFLGHEFQAHDRRARQALGEYLNAGADDLVYLPNATHGVNIIARSLPLRPGDEILTSNHEYGACNYAWEFITKKTGAVYKIQALPLPVSSQEEMVELFWRGVTPRTKLIFISHITSPTALRLPVEAICQRARQAGILTLVDGAHAPGQIPVDVQAVGADFYVGNCHKWMLSPKGVGFLYARREVQALIEPLVVSWGYHANTKSTSGSPLVDYLSWTGTRDPAAALSVPAAIQFMRENNWDQVRDQCHQLLRHALERLSEITALPPAYPLDSDRCYQMGIAPLPPVGDPDGFKDRLYHEFRIEVPIIPWQEQFFVRISVQGYNSEEDIEALVGGIKALLPALRA